MAVKIHIKSLVSVYRTANIDLTDIAECAIRDLKSIIDNDQIESVELTIDTLIEIRPNLIDPLKAIPNLNPNHQDSKVPLSKVVSEILQDAIQAMPSQKSSYQKFRELWQHRSTEVLLITSLLLLALNAVLTILLAS